MFELLGVNDGGCKKEGIHYRQNAKRKKGTHDV